jgi:Putative Flp pilus-assembly TadE/G-like/von Willebrand factor type A domain
VSALRHHLRREDGQSLVIVVLFLVVLLGFCALTIDVGHAYLAQRRLQSSVDAAALAGADLLPNTAAAQAGAAQYGNGDLNQPPGVDDVQMTVSTKCLTSVPGCTTANAVTVKETGSVKTVFGGILGIGSLNVNATATACSPCGTKPLDIMLVLDRTGSMCQAPDGTPNCADLAAAQNAMLQFLRLMDPSLDHVGLAVLPPAPSATASCPSIGAMKYLTPTDPYVIVPLSNDYAVGGSLNPSSQLVSKIGCVQGTGTTAYANALEMAQAELVKDGRPNVQKIIVFMSDGAANTGPTSYPDTSPYRTTPCHQGVNSAATIKGAGTLIYSIGFGVDDKSANTCKSALGGDEKVNGQTIDAKDALTEIASPGDYYNAPDDATLGSIWSAVAVDLLQGQSRLIDNNTS